MDSSLYLQPIELLRLVRFIYEINKHEYVFKGQVLREGEIVQLSNTNLVTEKNNVLRQKFFVQGRKLHEKLQFEVLHNRHLVGKSDMVKARVFDETCLFGVAGYALLEKLFILDQKTTTWNLSPTTLSLVE